MTNLSLAACGATRGARKSDADRTRRRALSEELRRDVAVHPVTAEIAELAGRIEGEQAARGVSIAFEDKENRAILSNFRCSFTGWWPR